jgi:hypothetical protein
MMVFTKWIDELAWLVGDTLLCHWGFHSLLELAMYSDPLDGACKHEGPAVYN